MLEVGLIVVGVILGLTVDNLRQAASDRARAREVLELIATELAENRARLASRLAYHETIGDSLRALAGRALGNQPITFGDMDRAMPEGVAPVLLSSTAWELAKASEALRHLDLRVLTAVSTAYQRQAFLQGKHDQVGANFYQAVNQDPDQFRGNIVAMRNLVGDVVFTERDLLEQDIPRALEAIAKSGVRPRAGAAR